MSAILSKYGESSAFSFAAVDYGGTDFISEPTFEAGDVQISKNGGAFVNTVSDPTYIGNGVFDLTLTATEMQAARIAVTIIDQSSPKVWEDTAILITTYGGSAAQLRLDVWADHVIRRTFQNACDSPDGDTKTGRSLLGAIASKVNRVAASAGTLTVYEDDDTTALFTQTITTDSEAAPIIEVNTD